MRLVVSGASLELVKKHARLAEIGGHSHIRSTREERVETLATDQLVGLLGHYTASVYLFGSSVEFERARKTANAAPHVGDRGIDLPGRIDVKSSALRNTRRPLGAYRLAVRPKEMYRDHCYVSALVVVGGCWADVRLMGWAYGEDFPREPMGDNGHPLRGAYVLENRDLRPMHELWLLLREEVA